MRFHSVMFSIYYALPGVFISYSDKTSDVLRDVGLEDHFIEYGIKSDEDFCREFDLDEDKAILMADSIIKDDTVFRERLELASNYLKRQADSAKEEFETYIRRLCR